MPENTLQRRKAFSPWLWLLLLVGIALLLFVYQQATTKKALLIQEDIQNRTSQNLHKNALLKQVMISADGRDITLAGEVNSQDMLDKANHIALRTYGVRLVNNQLIVSEPSISQATKPESVSISKAKVEPMPEEFAPLEEKIQANSVEIANQATDIKLSETKIAAERLSQLDFSNIKFEKNSSTLTESAISTLDQIVDALSENPAVHISIEGHTDTSGNPQLNLTLSEQRAQSVLNYLVDAGISESRISAKGYGDQFPIAANDTEAGRIKNRRIEIKVKNGE